MESDVITLQDVFLAKPPDEERAVDARGGPAAQPLSCTGLKPHFLEKMAAQRRASCRRPSSSWRPPAAAHVRCRALRSAREIAGFRRTLALARDRTGLPGAPPGASHLRGRRRGRIRRCGRRS